MLFGNTTSATAAANAVGADLAGFASFGSKQWHIALTKAALNGAYAKGYVWSVYVAMEGCCTSRSCALEALLLLTPARALPSKQRICTVLRLLTVVHACCWLLVSCMGT